MWKLRDSLSVPKIQRFEKPRTNNYAYAPEWQINQSKQFEKFNPLEKNLTTPEKWEYYNKVMAFIKVI